jgi:hypothetical protein
MKKILKTRLSAMEALYRFCQQNPLIVALLIALSNSVTALGLKIQSIISVQSKQQANNTGVTVTKLQLKDTMVSITAIVAFAMQAFAQKAKNMTLYNQLNFAPAELLSGSDSNAISKCREIYDIVRLIPEADRTPFGISDLVLTQMNDATDEFESDAPSTRNVISDKTAYTQSLDTLVGEGNDIMRKEILKLGRFFKTSNPDFYNGLRSSAKLQTSNTHTKIRVEATDDVTGNVISGLTAKIQGTSFEAITNLKGKCLIYLPEGTYTLICSKDHYIMMTLEVKVIRGSNTVKVQMSPSFTIPAITEEKKENA